MKSDGKHPAPCDLCGEIHYRQVALCKRCQPAVRSPFTNDRMRDVAHRLSDAALALFVEEYVQRHASRLQTIKEIAA